LDEIKVMVDEARTMGCRRWFVSGGEPMLHPDFIDIFDYITANSAAYSINTNGTLITPKIANLMIRKGAKMVALYGATADVHDHITRTPGSFDSVMQGIAYLKEAGAGFTIQLTAMLDNCHQLEEMKALAESLSPHWKMGAAWLFLSAYGDTKRNQEIVRQRLDPSKVVELNRPDLSYAEWAGKEENKSCSHLKADDRLFAACIGARRSFHIDPHGKMTFCGFVRDPELLCDLRKESLRECWDSFIPSLADRISGNSEYWDNCGKCDYRSDCHWCPAYAYLEHRRFSARVEYLCAISRNERRYKENWKENHRRYYQIGGISIQVESDLPVCDGTFDPKFKLFQVDEPGEDATSIRHHFYLPDLDGQDLGKEVYRKPPWAIYRKADSWVYLGISSISGSKKLHQVAVFNHDHSRGRIYNDGEDIFHKGDLHTLTLFPSDQILLARVLADREGCYLHSSGVVLGGNGLLFVGNSESGKSTIATKLKDKAEILCDDRMIVRRWDEGFKIHGTWSHGDVPEVSGNSAPLNALMFLEQAAENCLIPLEDKKEIIRKLLGCLIRPLVTTDWWEKMLTLVEQIANEVPCYRLQFDKSGEVVSLLEQEFGED
jgi:radical SAM protein with 4Fe4S-binding SPASM domain